MASALVRRYESDEALRPRAFVRACPSGKILKRGSPGDGYVALHSHGSSI